MGAHVDNFQSMQPLFRAKQVKLRLSLIGRLAPDRFLDLVQRADTLQRLGVQGIRACGVQFVELSPSMCPASCFGYPPGFVNRLISAVGIRLQRAVERFEMLLRMDALAVGRISAVPELSLEHHNLFDSSICGWTCARRFIDL